MINFRLFLNLIYAISKFLLTISENILYSLIQCSLLLVWSYNHVNIKIPCSIIGINISLRLSTRWGNNPRSEDVALIRVISNNLYVCNNCQLKIIGSLSTLWQIFLGRHFFHNKFLKASNIDTLLNIYPQRMFQFIVWEKYESTSYSLAMG